MQSSAPNASLRKNTSQTREPTGRTRIAGVFRDFLRSSGCFCVVPTAIGSWSILAASRCHCNSAANFWHTAVQLRWFKHISYGLDIVQVFAVMTCTLHQRNAWQTCCLLPVKCFSHLICAIVFCNKERLHEGSVQGLLVLRAAFLLTSVGSVLGPQHYHCDSSSDAAERVQQLLQSLLSKNYLLFWRAGLVWFSENPVGRFTQMKPVCGFIVVLRRSSRSPKNCTATLCAIDACIL